MRQHEDKSNEQGQYNMTSSKKEALSFPSIKKSGFTYDGQYWEYKNSVGETVGYVVRYNSMDGKKEFRQYTVNGGKLEAHKWYDEVAPFYNEHLLNSKLPVLIVEGEKTADAAQAIFGDRFCCISWVGGSSTAKKVDFERLRGRKVYICPDNDNPGYKAADALIAGLLQIAESVMVLDVKGLGVSDGWDIADLLTGSEIDYDTVLASLLSLRPLPKCIAFKKIDKYPYYTVRRKPEGVTPNAEHLLKSYNIDVRLNLMTNEVEVSNTAFNKYNNQVTFLTDIAIHHEYPTKYLKQQVATIGERHSYHPVRDFIDSKPWDGIDRLPDFLATVTAKNQELANKLIYRWMLGAIAAAYTENGIELQGALIFLGEQGIGKTEWIKRLLPKSMSRCIKTGVTLNLSDKDSRINATNSWLVELGEIDATFAKSAIAQLKSFITLPSDHYRAPYDAVPEEHPRRTAYFGSVNHEDYLRDTTGNRRWWTVHCTAINYDHKMDMQQVWAQFKSLYDNGETNFLTHEEQGAVNETNVHHMPIDFLHDALTSNFYFEDVFRENRLTATQIIEHLSDISHKDFSFRTLSQTLSKLGIHKKLKDGKTIYLMPPFRR